MTNFIKNSSLPVGYIKKMSNIKILHYKKTVLNDKNYYILHKYLNDEGYSDILILHYFLSLLEQNFKFNIKNLEKLIFCESENLSIYNNYFKQRKKIKDKYNITPERIKQYHRDTNKRYYQKNKDKIVAKRKIHYKNNIGGYKDRQKMYSVNNKLKIKKYQDQWRQDNADYAKKYWKKNKIIQKARYCKLKNQHNENCKEYYNNNKVVILAQKKHRRNIISTEKKIKLKLFDDYFTHKKGINV